MKFMECIDCGKRIEVPGSTDRAWCYRCSSGQDSLHLDEQGRPVSAAMRERQQEVLF